MYQFVDTMDDAMDMMEENIEPEESELITTVKFQLPKPDSAEASMNHKQKRWQELKKLSVRLHQAIENKEIDGLPGYTANRLFVDAKDRVKMNILPVYYKSVLTLCKQFAHSTAILPALMTCAAMNRKDSRLIMSRVLCILLTSTEFEGGRIGLLIKGEGVTPISHYQLMREYMLRFGCLIDEDTWYAAFARLTSSGYIYSTHVKAAIEVKNEAQAIQRIVRSSASYKQFTAKFFNDFKVTFYPNVARWIRDAIKASKRSGFVFKWLTFSQLATKIRERLEAQFLNDLIRSSGPICGEVTPNYSY
ncbi:hypothetical protein [Vibrio scophthalmi]|uniref:hypothetical protein n=1 Tax=Vibrio scophthalmi TaxID=45658 RepID=UPI0012EA4EDC|nr:hypothetical protein [Vibrio scophthalmi]